jgi:hypothetical protein
VGASLTEPLAIVVIAGAAKEEVVVVARQEEEEEGTRVKDAAWDAAHPIWRRCEREEWVRVGVST